MLYRISAPRRRAGVRPVRAWSTPTRSPPAPTSRAWSSATRTSSSTRCASGSPSPRRSATCSRPCCCCRPVAATSCTPRSRRPADAAGAPAATDVDQAGRTHAIWLLAARPGAGRAARARRRRRAGRRRRQPPQPGRADRRAAALPGRGDHARVGGDPALQPAGQRADHRRRPSCSTGCAPRAPRSRRGGRARRSPAPAAPIQLYAGGQGYAVTLPPAPRPATVDNLDHALVERVLLRDALGLDPGDKRITYVGGDYPARVAAPARSTRAGPSWRC